MSALRKFTVVENREAWLVAVDNLDEVAKWCGGSAVRDGDESYVVYPVPENDLGHISGVAFVNDVIVKQHGQFYDIPDWLFERDCASQWTEWVVKP